MAFKFFTPRNIGPRPLILCIDLPFSPLLLVHLAICLALRPSAYVYLQSRYRLQLLSKVRIRVVLNFLFVNFEVVTLQVTTINWSTCKFAFGKSLALGRRLSFWIDIGKYLAAEMDNTFCVEKTEFSFKSEYFWILKINLKRNHIWMKGTFPICIEADFENRRCSKKIWK